MSFYSVGVTHPTLPETFLSGGGGVVYGTSDPSDASPPAGDSGWYYRTDTGALWVWNSADETWDSIIV